MHWRVRGRAPRGDGAIRVVRDPDILRSHLEDAAHFHGGHAEALVAPGSEGEVARTLEEFSSILPIGAQSSLTGGATPHGSALLSTARLNRILSIGHETVRLQPGVTLAALDAALAESGGYYPPAPTFTGASIGGTVATNAAGAATFKYGATRSWVQSITVVLPTGDVLDIERGAVRAHDEGYFELELARGLVRVPVPRYVMPRVSKLSAGYFAEPGMDLIDLFIGSEGTLGIVTEITLRILSRRPALSFAFVPFSSRTTALELVRQVRERALQTWRSIDDGLDVSAIEHLDRRCLAIAREDGLDRAAGVRWPDDADTALLLTVELLPGTTSGDAYDDLGGGEASFGPLGQLAQLLERAGVMDYVEIAVPGDPARATQLLNLRESLPASVNARIGRASQNVDARIAKTAADMIVPFEHFAAMLEFYEAEFRRRGLDWATWGHISDGNVHPNVLPRSYADVESGAEAILRFGAEAIRLGGAPLAEHGVGRHPVKQQLLRMLYGDAGIEDMRSVRKALDPEAKLAPGVLFEI